MKAVQCKQPGGPEVLCVGSEPCPSPGPGEVLVHVSHSAVNRADTLQRQGAYPPPQGASHILGLEAAGKVAALGPGVNSWKVGDPVMALLSGGGNAEYVTVAASHLLPVPSSMEMEKAAAIPEVWLTAYQLLYFVGEIKKGDVVLIHAGGSGVGTAAIQLVKRAGGKSIVTAGSQAKLDLAIQLGAEKGINYKQEDFEPAVQEWTKGRGVDIILDCVGGSYSQKNINCLAPDARWVVYGLMGGGDVSGPLLTALLRKRASIRGSTLRSRDDEYKGKLVAAFARDCLPGFTFGALKPVIDCVYDLKEIGKAHERMGANANIGKIVLKI